MKKFPPPFLPMFHCLCIGWSTIFYWKSYQEVRTYMYATCNVNMLSLIDDSIHVKLQHPSPPTPRATQAFEI